MMSSMPNKSITPHFKSGQKEEMPPIKGKVFDLKKFMSDVKEIRELMKKNDKDPEAFENRFRILHSHE